MSTAGTLIVRHYRPIIVIWVLAVLLTAPAASQLSGILSQGGYEVPGSESARVNEVVRREIDGGTERQALYLIFRRVQWGNASFIGVSNRVRAALRGAPAVRLGSLRLAPDRNVALMPLEFGGDFRAVGRVLSYLHHRLAGIPSVVIGGQAAVYSASTQIASKDLATAERIALPMTLLILAVAFLSVVAAGLPILSAICALTVTFGALFAVAQFLETSVFVTNTAVLLALGLSIDYSLFMVSRYREMLDRGYEIDDALQTMLLTTGRAIAFSGLTVAVSLCSLASVGVNLFTSMAVGATLAAAVAVLAALTLLPAVLRMLGPRIDRLTLRPAARLASQAGIWQSLARFTLRHRISVTVSTVVALVLLAVPVTKLAIGFPSTRILLPGSSSDSLARALRDAESAFGPGALSPLEVVTRAQPQSVRDALIEIPGISEVSQPVSGTNGWHELIATSSYEVNTPASNSTLARLRAMLHRRFRGTFVGGQTAAGRDLAQRVLQRFPRVIAIASFFTFILLFYAFRCVIVPLKAIATNLLTVSATLGILTILFQWAGGAGMIAHFVPIFLFALLFGLSMDYEVFLISRVREEYLGGASNDRAIEHGLVSSARPITLAAAVMVTVFASFAVSQLEPFRQFGVGMSIAVFIDATVVRCLLVPAAMALLGDRNWWAPRAFIALRSSPAIPSGSRDEQRG